MSVLTSPPPATIPTKNLTYQELDILHCLRGFCAFYVVIHHAKAIMWSGGRQYLTAFPRATWGPLDYGTFLLDMLSSSGFEMVVFFFVLSGFFIRYAQRKRHRPALAFYINRIVRIYPPYLTSVLLSIAALAVIARLMPEVLNTGVNRPVNTELAHGWQELQHFSPSGLIRVLGFSQVSEYYIGCNGAYWSLLPEALFYLCIPLAFWRIRLYYVFSALAFLVGVGLAAAHVSFKSVTQFLFIYNFYFAVGVMLYDVVVQTNWLDRFRRANSWVLLVVVTVLFLSLQLLALLQYRLVSGVVAVVLAVICVSALLAGKLPRQNAIVRLMHSIGVFSFSLYLFHFPLLLMCYALMVHTTGNLFSYARYYWLAIPVVTIGSYLLYWCTERVSVNYFRKV